MLRQQLLDSSRGRIVGLLQRGPLTVDELATQLKISTSGVRALLTAMERDGVVRRAGSKPGTTRPSRVFAVTADVEQLLSRAYVPLLTQVVEVIARGLPADQLDQLLREAGRNLAGELSSGRPLARLSARVQAASRLLNAQLGAVTYVEENGKFLIRGSGCPLSALTAKASRRVPGDGKPRRNAGRRPHPRMLRADGPSAVLLRDLQRLPRRSRRADIRTRLNDNLSP